MSTVQRLFRKFPTNLMSTDTPIDLCIAMPISYASTHARVLAHFLLAHSLAHGPCFHPSFGAEGITAFASFHCLLALVVAYFWSHSGTS